MYIPFSTRMKACEEEPSGMWGHTFSKYTQYSHDYYHQALALTEINNNL